MTKTMLIAIFKQTTPLANKNVYAVLTEYLYWLLILGNTDNKGIIIIPAPNRINAVAFIVPYYRKHEREWSVLKFPSFRNQLVRVGWDSISDRGHLRA